MPPDRAAPRSLHAVQQQYRMIHDIYVLLDGGDWHVLSAFNLTTSQYGALLFLDAHTGQRLTVLSERLLLDKSTITRLVSQLERDGLVRRVIDPDDRRAQRILLTEAGQDRRARAHAAHQESLERRFGVLDETEQAQFRALLEKLRAGLRAALDAA